MLPPVHVKLSLRLKSPSLSFHGVLLTSLGTLFVLHNESYHF